MIRLFVFSMIFLVLPVTGNAKEVMDNPVSATVLRVIDGDTIEVNAHIWLGVKVNTIVRIYGIDTPEIKGKCAYESDLARQAKHFMEQAISGKNKQIVLHNIMYDKYGGRIVAAIETNEYKDLGDELINKGFAYSYFGERKRSWCHTEEG